MKRAHIVILFGAFAATPAFADAIIDAKVQCQVVYRSGSGESSACLHGVEASATAPDGIEGALGVCRRDFTATEDATACQRGVALHARYRGSIRESDRSSFSYSWRQGRPAAQLGIGNYQVLVGDAQRSIDDCMRAFEGSSTPPSCLSGITAQHAPPHQAPQRDSADR